MPKKVLFYGRSNGAQRGPFWCHLFFFNHEPISLNGLLYYLGLGSGLSYTAGVVVIGSYFVEKRPLALGLSISACGVGSMAFPWITRLVHIIYSE